MPLDDNASPASWRDLIAVHPAADLFPMMGDDELRELGRDILANGLQQPLVFFGDRLVDGRNRLAAVEIAAPPEDRARLIGLMLTGGRDPDLMVSFPQPRVLWPPGRPAARPLCEQDDDAVAFVISANIRRRHLTGEQKRELIGKLLIDRPERSDRSIARLAGSNRNIVGEVRADLVQRGDVSQNDTRTDSIGREQPATKPGPARSPSDKLPMPTQYHEITVRPFPAETAGRLMTERWGFGGKFCRELVDELQKRLAEGKPAKPPPSGEPKP